MTKTIKVAQPSIDVDDEDFNSIMRGLDQAKGIIEGTADPSSYRLHQVRVPDQVDVKRIRKGLNLSQEAFASAFGFSVGAVRDWEQHRKEPERTSRLLLTIVDKRPEVIQEVLAD